MTETHSMTATFRDDRPYRGRRPRLFTRDAGDCIEVTVDDRLPIRLFPGDKFELTLVVSDSPRPVVAILPRQHGATEHQPDAD